MSLIFSNKNEVRTQAGFTFVELIVVVAIIGILAAIVLFSVSAVREQGRIARAEEELQVIEGALTLFKAREGVLPTALGVQCSFCGLRGGPTHHLRARWANLINQVNSVTGVLLPERDPWGNYYGFMNNYGATQMLWGTDPRAKLPSIVCSLGPDEVLQTWINWSRSRFEREAQGDDICLFMPETDDSDVWLVGAIDPTLDIEDPVEPAPPS
jgi:prepilin-type N-terminal cleavage/methylation domain-containing protein